MPIFGLTFIIDISRFKESFPTGNRDSFKAKSRTFKADIDQGEDWWNYERVQESGMGDLYKIAKKFGFDEYSRLDDIAEFAKLNPDKIGVINGRTAEEIINDYKSNFGTGFNEGYMIAKGSPLEIFGVLWLGMVLLVQMMR